jgi:hypothetical protein
LSKEREMAALLRAESPGNIGWGVSRAYRRVLDEIRRLSR